ncbi:CaiB/BaiF CoA-transferase family protein [uncultured Marinobacter sp.]|uniref:CaiB/BaiF CoA transferase family protein n=1 Tax=uncultured Marinobacter sp. TaxID=187379 RepID=UPI0030D96C41|tara:strand:+ start:38 stop:1261 length:1224 start_codon:yes stop_codon:yes gene_type:complete
MAGPLKKLRVLDLSRVLAGPWSTQILADMGAEVIKIERPDSGDDTRLWGPPWLKAENGENTRESAYFLAANRGKHSLTVDISQPEGLELIRELASQSDILVENFKSGGLAKKGLDYATLSALNPGLIYCSITGFGHTGPMAEMPGYDYLIQAQGGLMSITGAADDQPGAGPKRVGVAVADLTTGMNATIAILGALYHRTQTGEGQHIDLALLDVQVSWLANQAQNYFCSGEPPTRTGDYHPNLVPYQPFPTADDQQIIIAIGNNGQFQRFCEAIGQGELAQDARFATNAERVKHRVELIKVLVSATKTRTLKQWTLLLNEIGVPCGPIQDIAQVFDDPQVQARGMEVTLDSANGPVKSVANPIKYSKTPIEYHKAPPALGEDTSAVLERVLQKTASEIEALKRKGVV